MSFDVKSNGSNSDSLLTSNVNLCESFESVCSVRKL